ncbi:hypothetical protein [Treponema sp.]|uniref:hypothetical protein n=1 Tax=Treponema sp. TaxID=166 RepID=UPI003F0C3492
MNINYIKQKRTKICGLVSILLLFLSIILLLIDFATDSKIDSFFIGSLSLTFSLVFAIIGIIKGNRESLGYVLSFPSVIINIAFYALFFLVAFTEKPKESSDSKPNFALYKIIAVDYMYQYDWKGYESTCYRRKAPSPASAFFALCEAYGFFDKKEPGNYWEGCLMALLDGFYYTTKEDSVSNGPYYTVMEYFQGSGYNTFHFWNETLDPDEEIYRIIIQDDYHQNKKIFECNAKTGIVRYAENSGKKYSTPELEKQLERNYLLYSSAIYYSTYKDDNWNEEYQEKNFRIIADQIGMDYDAFIKDVKEEGSSSAILFYKRMKKSFDTYSASEISDFHIALFSNCLHKKIRMDVL